MKFAILNCILPEGYQTNEKKENVNGELNYFSQRFVESFGNEEDEWDIFNCHEKQWPSLEEAKSVYDAIFITGSLSSVYSEEDQHWIIPLCQILKEFCENDIKIIGICFGCQILAHCLGGNVGPNPSGKFTIKIENIKLKEELKEFFPKLEKNNLNIIELHMDQVLKLPEGGKCLATSETSSNEIWHYKDKVIAIQSHPEIEREVASNKIIQRIKENKLISEEEAEESTKSLNEESLDSELLSSFIFDFAHKKVQKEAYKYNEADNEEKSGMVEKVEMLGDKITDVIIKKLRDGLNDYVRLEEGNKIIKEEFSKLHGQIQKMNRDFEVVHEIHNQTRSGVIQVIEELGDVITSLENSINTLDEETIQIKPLDICDGSCFFQYIFKTYGNIFLNHKESSGSSYSTTINSTDLTPFNTNWDYNDIKWGNINEYIPTKKLGNGSYGDVFEGINVKTNKKIVVKVLKPVTRERIEKEIKIIKELEGHQNIIKLIDIIRDPRAKTPTLIFEHVENINHKNLYPKFTAEEIQYYSYQLLKAISHTHENGIIHRDIKPHNTVIDPRHQKLRLIDFGLSIHHVKGEIRGLGVGSRHYRAPELLLEYEYYDYAVDMWSFGCIFAEMLFKIKTMFNGSDADDQITKIAKVLGSSDVYDYMNRFGLFIDDDWIDVIGNFQKKPWAEFINDGNKHVISSLALDLLDKILVIDHFERYRAIDALNHPYFDTIRAYENIYFKN